MTATQLTYEEDHAVGTPQVLAPGTVLSNGQYRIDRHLGSGGFGITYLARDSLERTVVIKECYPEAICSRESKTVQVRSANQVEEFKTMVTMFVREARSIAKLNHPNIVGVHQVFEDNHTAYMALDFVDGPDLLALLENDDKPIDPAIIKGLLLKSLDAVQTIHNQDMLHRDLSPDNILINQFGDPILIDFGAAREQASKKSRALSAIQVVKDGYSPQEFYIAGGLQSHSSDLYSLAATFAHLIVGEAPPNSQTRLAEIAAHSPDPYVPLAGRFDAYEPEFLNAIDTAMSVFPRDRIQSAEEWLLQIDPDKRKQRALAAAEEDSEIAETVSNLISLVGKVHEKTMPPTSLAQLHSEAAPSTPANAPGFGSESSRAKTTVHRPGQPQPAVSEISPAAASDATQPEELGFEEAEDDLPAFPPPLRVPDLDDDLDPYEDTEPHEEMAHPDSAPMRIRPRRISAPNVMDSGAKRLPHDVPKDHQIADALRGKKTIKSRISATNWFVRIVVVSLIGLTLYQASRVGFSQLPASVIDTFLGLVFAEATGTGTPPDVLRS